MKIIIKTDSGEKELDVKSPKGKHVNHVWTLLTEMEEGDPKAVMKYIQYIDETVSKLSGLTIEELNDLDLEEKKKLTEIITKKVMDSLDFLNASR